MMENLTDVLAWLGSGDARLVAAGVLALVVWVVRARVPTLSAWSARDESGWLSWLTAKRKELAMTALLGMAPVVVLLADKRVGLVEVGTAVVEVVLVALGVASVARAVSRGRAAVS